MLSLKVTLNVILSPTFTLQGNSVGVLINSSKYYLKACWLALKLMEDTNPNLDSIKANEPSELWACETSTYVVCAWNYLKSSRGSLNLSWKFDKRYYLLFICPPFYW